MKLITKLIITAGIAVGGYALGKACRSVIKEIDDSQVKSLWEGVKNKANDVIVDMKQKRVLRLLNKQKQIKEKVQKKLNEIGKIMKKKTEKVNEEESQ